MWALRSGEGGLSGTFADSKLRAPGHLAGYMRSFVAQYSALCMLFSLSYF